MWHVTRAIRVGDLVQDAQGQVGVVVGVYLLGYRVAYGLGFRRVRYVAGAVSVGRTWEAMAKDAGEDGQ